MTVEVMFTPKGTDNEITFTIVDEGNDHLYLFGISNLVEYKFPLKSENGLLSLDVQNPFDDSDDIVRERLVGLSSDYVESRSQGFESTTGTAVDTTLENKPGYGPDDIFVENKPFSLKQIIDLIDSEDIELTPDFQRNFIWDKTRQSKLIESILLGLPLPSIYLSQYEDGRLTIVDGLQRLTTIRLFMKDELVLSNLEYLKNCNGRRYSQLENILSPLRMRRFGQTQIMCFVIDYRSPSKLKFDLFRRLNTGGKPLNNQEIRNCISKPYIQRVLKDMVHLQSFGLSTDWSVKDTRMEAREAAMRFIYFYEQYTELKPTGNYSGDMDGTLDDFTDELNKRPAGSLDKYVTIYDRALSNAHHCFSKHCFRKVLPDTVDGRRAPVNKLLMLCFSVLLSKYTNEDILGVFVDEGALIEPLAHHIDDNDLFPTITYGTNAKANIELGLKSFRAFLENNLNIGHE